MQKTEKKITVKEFLEMEFEGEDAYYELIDGKVYKKYDTSLPYQKTSHLHHQEALQNINFALSKFVRSKKAGKVFVALTDVYLNKGNHVMPDIFFISNKNKKILDYQEGVVIGVPDLIVEILSPSTMGNDRFDKKKAYKEAGVMEYWLVDPNNEAVEIYENKKRQFEPFSFAAEEGIIKSKILKGFELDIKDIFEK